MRLLVFFCEDDWEKICENAWPLAMFSIRTIIYMLT